MRFVSLLLVLAAALSAQPAGAPIILPNGAAAGNQAATPPETKPEDLGSIEGQVLNARTGEFLNKATLTLTRADPPQNVNVPPPSYNSNTDGSGRFSLKEIEPGKYRLRVSRNGFVQGEYGARGPTRPGTTITLDRAKKITDIVFRLTPHGVISGRILDEDGDPVPNVQIQLARTGYAQGRKQLIYVNSASTNDLGEYRIFGIAPGKYLLSAIYRSFGFVMPNSIDRSTTSNADEVPTYYPGTIDPTAAAQVEVTAGSNLSGINLKLSKARTTRVKGHVTQGITTGRTMISVMIVPRRADTMTTMLAMNRNRAVDAKGNFEITGVVPGSYYVRAMMNANGKNYSGSLPVEVGSRNVENLNVTIGTGTTLTGNLRVDGGTTENLSNIQLRLLPREPGAMMFSMNQGKVNEDGSFQLEGVTPDQYNINLFGLPEGFYIKAIRAGENDVLISGLDLAGGAPRPLQVVLSPRAGTVTGAVQNPTTHQPAAGATVVLVPQEKDRKAVFSFYKMTTSDQTGSYSFKNVTPGDYKVFAWEDIEPAAYADPEFVKPVEAKGEAVTIKEGAAPAVQVTLIPVEDPAAK